MSVVLCKLLAWFKTHPWCFIQQCTISRDLNSIVVDIRLSWLWGYYPVARRTTRRAGRERRAADMFARRRVLSVHTIFAWHYIMRYKLPLFIMREAIHSSSKYKRCIFFVLLGNKLGEVGNVTKICTYRSYKNVRKPASTRAAWAGEACVARATVRAAMSVAGLVYITYILLSTSVALLKQEQIFGIKTWNARKRRAT